MLVWVVMHYWWVKSKETCTCNTPVCTQKHIPWIIYHCTAVFHYLTFSWLYFLGPLPLLLVSTFCITFISFTLPLCTSNTTLVGTFQCLTPQISLGMHLQVSTRCGKKLWSLPSTCQSWPSYVSSCGTMTPLDKISLASVPSPSTAWCRVRLTHHLIVDVLLIRMKYAMSCCTLTIVPQ